MLFLSPFLFLFFAVMCLVIGWRLGQALLRGAGIVGTGVVDGVRLGNKAAAARRREALSWQNRK